MKGRLGLVVLVVALFLTSFGEAQARRKRPHKKAAPKRPVAAAPAQAAPAAESEVETTTPDPAPAAAESSKKPKGPKVMDFTGLAVEGKLRTPQLLYFLGRVKEELQRASLENRSFMPELVRSVDEGAM